MLAIEVTNHRELEGLTAIDEEGVGMEPESWERQQTDPSLCLSYANL